MHARFSAPCWLFRGIMFYALQTRRANVIAYIPYYSGKEACHNALVRSVAQSFPQPLQTGQLQVVSPPLQQDNGSYFKFAQQGLDFAYAAELGYHFSDLYLFLQAGTRLLEEWWLRSVPVPEGETGGNPMWDDSKNATVFMKAEEATQLRDYGMEVLMAYESRLQYDESGQAHALCYMNFATDVIFQEERYAAMERPTGALFPSSDLLRLSLVLRSYLPYGKFPVSKLLHRYCNDLLWETDTSNAPLELFQYALKTDETIVETPPISVPLPEGATYPFIVPRSSDLPSWVTVEPSMVGPHSTLESNPFYRSDVDIIPAASGRSISNERSAQEKVWMTFAIPTAWRPKTENGNGYVVECIRQLLAIIKEYFVGEFKAKILVVVTGQTMPDLRRHYDSLQIIFAPEISTGVVELVHAPLQQYPTLHGLDIHFKDTESRVRWRAKQNLDMSAAFFAAKGNGKYIMLIEDDSGFRPTNFFKMIRQTLGNLIGKDTGLNNVAEFPIHIDVNGQDIPGKYVLNPEKSPNISYESLTGTKETEHWSQVRFAFGYSGVLVHDEDALVYGMLHFLLYQEKPCDLMESLADSVRSGASKDHYMRWNKKFRSITHLGKISSLNGKVYPDDEIIK